MAGENVNRRLNIYINDREVTNSLIGVNREMAKVRGQMRGLNKGSADYQHQLDKLNKEYKYLEAVQKEFKDDIYGVKKGFDDTTKSAKDTTEELGAAQEAFSNLFTGLRTGNLLQVKEGLMAIKLGLQATAKAAWAFVKTPIGATIVILAGIAKATKEWINYNEELAKATRTTEAITKLSGEALNQARIQAQVIEQIYGKPFEDTLNTANVLVNEFGISFEEALNKIENNLVAGAQYNDEYLQSIKEYSTFFAQAGYSVEEFQGIINAGFDLGIYSDKLPDAIKEFSLSINEQTKATKDALEDAYGKEFTDKILKGVKDGSISAKEALKLMAEEATRVGLNAKTAQQLTADLFRGAGEDAGGALKIFQAVERSYKLQTLALTPLQESLNEVAASQKLLIETQDALFQSEGFELWKNDLITMFNQVKQGFYSLIYEITNGFGSMQEKAKEDSEKTAINNYTTDALAAFDDYIKRREKSMGKEFNLEKVRQERLEMLRKQYSSSGAGSWDASESQIQVQKRLEAEIEAVQKYIPKSVKINTEKTEAELAAEAKLRADAAKKHHAELEKQLKEREALDKQLLATQRAFQDAQLELMADGYEKEKAKINLEYDRKIEDLRSHLFKESELKELQKQIDAAKNSGNKGEAERLQGLLNQKIAINQAYNDTIIAAEQTRNLKIGQLQEKYLAEEFKREEEAHQRNLLRLDTKQKNELNGIKSLDDAKEILSKSLSEKEINGITSLEEAKKAIQKQHLTEKFEMEKANLDKVVKQYQSLLALDLSMGNTFLSDEQRDEIVKNLEIVENKLAGLVPPPDEAESRTFDEAKNHGIDILGFDAGKWEALFDGLETFAEKLAAVQMVAGALKNAFSSYFDFMAAGEARTLQKFERSADRRKKLLSDQLEKGMISQELYTARVAKIDEELNRKKAEIEYKQAKRQKIFQAAQIVANTAQAIMSIWAQVPKFDFGVSAGIMTGVVSALGALQLATVLRQPLPEKGYKMGGFTPRGNRNKVAGVTHQDEYVIPADVLYDDDPAMPDIMSYIEGKRTGKIIPSSSSSGTETENLNNKSIASNVELYLAKIIDRNSDLIEKQLKEGLIAWLEVDIPTAKKIRKKIQELELIENSARK
ncbi:hypothetical protein LXD69_07360 [Flavobacterium sediminilitoris]|uniref:Phage tail tape measure protein domain-containing protein n=1 Tax=Flavobacterium sediminilitoris TaxID=2024526 RepID=A0ABY4HUD3_9FLAO|nr:MULTISPECIES: phage tail tape measure protein [Flavobacterium]UOX35329.1 hypothetical protein LXD69_07360 [Flavobacterium sediminilitoris]